MTTILITLDGSAASKAVLAPIETIAAGLNATVKLFTVRHPVDETPRRGFSPIMHAESLYSVPGASTAIYVERGGEPAYAEDETQATERLLSEGRDYLSAVGKPFADRGLKVEVHAVIGDDAAKEIIKYAQEQHVDLIAMASHGRGGLRDIVQGSVASAVMRSGVAPVFLVRPTK